MTAYAVPPQWAHGDYPRAADLNKLSTGQIHLYESLPTYTRNSAVRELGSNGRAAFTHKLRYLHYKSTGQIIDPAGIDDDVSLPNPTDNGVNTYDLDTVPWLSYGALYYVEGVVFASEESSG